MANLINLIFYIKEQSSSIVFDPSNEISDLKKIISLSHNIPVEKFDLYYKNKKIHNEKLEIYDVIGGENVPVFHVNPKSNFFLK